jgi:peptide/nickel transport system substrate-binding protein
MRAATATPPDSNESGHSGIIPVLTDDAICEVDFPVRRQLTTVNARTYNSGDRSSLLSDEPSSGSSNPGVMIQTLRIVFSLPPPRWGILLISSVLLLVSACNGFNPVPTDDTPTVDDDPTTEIEEEPEEGGSLVVAIPEEPDSLNFSLTTSPSAQWILSTVDARMIRINAENDYEPTLLREVPTLENGGISDDGLTYTIRFLPDITWSDGEPVDARDFKFTWETLTTPGYPAAALRGWSHIEDVTVSSDNLSAVIRLRNPSAEFIHRVLAGGSGEGAGFLLPRHRLEETSPDEIAAHEYGAEEHIGAGPFQVVEWEPGVQLTVERNPGYWGDPPLLDRIVFRFTESPRDAIAQVTTGDVDMSVNLPESSLLDAIESDETEAVITPRAGAVKTYAFNFHNPTNLNLEHPIFRDREVRQAIAMGFNRERVIETLMLNQTDIPGTLLSNTLWEHGELEPLPYDPERAAELLEEAGWELDNDGTRYRAGVALSFTLTTTAGDDPDAVLRQRVQDMFIEDMAELGIQVEPMNYEPSQLYGTDETRGVLGDRNFDMVDIPWNDRTTLDMFVERVSEAFIPSPEYPEGANLMGYANEDVNRLLREQATTLDPDERAELLREVQEIFMNDTPVIPVYEHIEIDVVRNYVHGLNPGPTSGLWWNVEEWWISSDDVVVN